MDLVRLAIPRRTYSELAQQLLIGRRQLGAVLVPVLCHVSHLVLLLCRKLHR